MKGALLLNGSEASRLALRGAQRLALGRRLRAWIVKRKCVGFERQ